MTSPASTPIFGRRTAPARRVPFVLISYNQREEETEHPFTARATIDASTALQANSNDPSVAARAIQNLLLRTLVDDDGISREVAPRRVGEPDDADTEDTDDDGDTGDVEVYGGDLANEEWTIGDEGKTFPSRDLALAHAKENGSSLRRFIDLMDNPLESVELTALRGLVKLLSKEGGGGRPTQRSGGSSRPRTQKRRR